MIATTYPSLKKKQKRDNERGINYPWWIQMSDSSRGHKLSTRNGSVIDSDLTGIWNIGIWLALRTVCSFRKIKQKKQPRARETASPPIYFRSPQNCQPYPLVRLVTSHLARSRGGTGN
jgi:hypothetical protein